MNRRELILLMGAAMTSAPALRAQQTAIPVIGILNTGRAGPAGPFDAAIRQGLSETGYVEGQNVALEYRWARITTTGCRNWPPSLSASRST